MLHIAYFQSSKGLNLWIMSLIKWRLGIDMLSSFLVHPTAARDWWCVPPRDFSDHMKNSTWKKKVQTFTVSRTSTNSLLYAKVWVNKRKSFELSLIHRLKQIFVGWRKLRHVHGKVRIKVLGVVIRRLREEKKKTLRSKEVSIFSEASCRGSDNVFLCCCLLLRVVAQSSKPVKLRAKGCNNSQHCFARSSRKLGHHGLLIQTLIFSIFLKGLGSVLKGNLHSYYRISLNRIKLCW